MLHLFFFSKKRMFIKVISLTLLYCILIYGVGIREIRSIVILCLPVILYIIYEISKIKIPYLIISETTIVVVKIPFIVKIFFKRDSKLKINKEFIEINGYWISLNNFDEPDKTSIVSLIS